MDAGNARGHAFGDAIIVNVWYSCVFEELCQMKLLPAL